MWEGVHFSSLEELDAYIMEFEFKRSALKQLKNYKKKNPVAYKMIFKKLGEIMENSKDTQ